jgi:predicted aminopeptidase
VANVSAYSTLGWFDDPVLNTFINWPDYRLAGLIFHELSHQRLFIKGDSRFNESFAMAIQQAGTERWLERTGSREQITKYRHQLSNRRQVFTLIEQARDDLEKLYASDIDDPAKREHKQQRLQALQNDYKELASGFELKDGFGRWFNGDLNNAKLLSVSTYHAWVPAFRNMLQDLDDDYAGFYAYSEKIAGLEAQQRTRCIESWLKPGMDQDEDQTLLEAHEALCGS